MGVITDINGEFIEKTRSKNNIIICYSKEELAAKIQDKQKYVFGFQAYDKEDNEYRVVEGFKGFEDMKEFIDNIEIFREKTGLNVIANGTKRKYSLSKSFKYSKAYIARNLVKNYYEKVTKRKYIDNISELNSKFDFPNVTDLRFYSMMERYYYASFCLCRVDSETIFDNVYYRDFTQHYSSIAAERPMPYAAKRISKRSELPEHWFGCWRVAISKGDLERLPEKLQKLIVQGDFKLSITEMDKEVYEALGIRFVECLRLYEVKMAPISETIPALKFQIDMVFNWRKRVKEEIKKPGNENNKYLKFLNTIFKLTNERIYGDSARRYFMIEENKNGKLDPIVYYHRYFKRKTPKISTLYDDVNVVDWSIDEKAGYCPIWQYNEARHILRQKRHHLPKLFGVYIVSYSRRDQMEIVNFIANCGGKCLYTDTDSFFYQCDYDCLDKFRDKEDGDYDFLKLEHYFSKAKFVGKKWWIGEDEKGIEYAAAGATGLIDGTTVENFGSKRGVFPTVRAQEAVEEWLKEK